MRFLFLSCFLFLAGFGSFQIHGQELKDRWKIESPQSILWEPTERLPHKDHIEMSGRQISGILRYSVDADTAFHLSATLVWPSFRTLPNNTGGSYRKTFPLDLVPFLMVNNRSLLEKVKRVKIGATLKVESQTKENLRITRTFFPSISKPVFLEGVILKNASQKPIRIEIPEVNLRFVTDTSLTVRGPFRSGFRSSVSGTFTLASGDSLSFFGEGFCVRRKDADPEINVDIERRNRQFLIQEWGNSLQLETPDSILNTAFSFAKVRAAESIFETAGGLMHSPGGEAYYAAIWANDQAEYIGPFFPFLGYPVGNEASLNAYLHFTRFMNPEFKPIPSSIIAEGTDTWHGRGDRGDQAMLAYGAARFALASGDPETGKKVWPLVEWCLEFLHRKLTPEGVPASDCDELEGRFPAGKANLSTACLYYDALLSAAFLAEELKIKSKPSRLYRQRAKDLVVAIENYFGTKIEGFESYRYYKENEVLRAWICMPLAMGIFKRTKGTTDALFSNRLWTKDGLATEAGKPTFWDRSTLYALRGIFWAGERERALPYLQYYSRRRLLGEHVPYPIEAFPEGNQRHLSAESGLYCRVMTEGLFGIRPSGFHRFFCKPQLPNGWNEMTLRKIRAFGKTFDLDVKRSEGKSVTVRVFEMGKEIFSKTIPNGTETGVAFRK